MGSKTSRFAFTEASLRDLPPPATGRAWHYDTKATGLCVCKSAAGGCSFYFYKWVNGRPSRTLIGKFPATTVKAARDAAGEAMGKVAKGEDPAEERRNRRQEATLKILWEHWLLHAEAHKKPVSVYEDKLKYNKFLAPWANRRLGTITKGQVQELHARIGRESGIYAANRMLALLRAMYNTAEEVGYRGANPAKGVKLFKEQSRDRFLQPDELGRFFAALDVEGGVARDFFLTLLFTGARRSNVQAMRWQDVDLNTGIWRIPDTKAGMPVIVPLVVPVVAVLMLRRQEANGSPWVFPGRKGKPLANPKWAWARIVKTAELTDIRPHDIRRSLGSWMAGQNTSLPIIGKMLGHKTAVATMIYSRLAVDPVREAAERAVAAMLAAGGQTKLLTNGGGNDRDS